MLERFTFEFVQATPIPKQAPGADEKPQGGTRVATDDEQVQVAASKSARERCRCRLRGSCLGRRPTTRRLAFAAGSRCGGQPPESAGHRARGFQISTTVADRIVKRRSGNRLLAGQNTSSVPATGSASRCASM